MARIWNKHKQSNTPLKRKVFVAMSGGVDSSVAAALLKYGSFSAQGGPASGWDVSGVFMKFWTAPTAVGENKCCSVEAYHDALAVADKLGIKLYSFNFEDEFKKRVVDYFIKTLKRGDTPNPCVVCNKEIKFGLLLEKILKLGGDYVATGHYVRRRRTKLKVKNKKLKVGCELLKAKDKNKDQSYFLWTIKQKQLAKFLFPVGDYTKPEIRKMAKDFGLPVFQKRDSEDLCFVGDHLGGFIGEYVKPKVGNIIDIYGNVLGRHNGLSFYTIGQRKDIKLPNGPWYVYKKDGRNNNLIVADEKNKKILFSDELNIRSMNWISGKTPKLPIEVMAKIRYQHKPAKATLTKKNNGYIIKFQKPQMAITPGQSAVFYKGDELLGGGIIK
jgi:tRNA-uridine 2-sulfurtransferase